MLSLVVIARNEGDRLARCLRSVPWASQRLVVVDTSTTDDTAEVARREGAEVIWADWPGHVAQKNRALEAARTPWALSLDADEWLTPAAGEAVRAAVADPRGASGFSLPRCSEWLGRPMRHGRWYPDRKLRVVCRERARWVGDDPHDRLEVDGLVRALQGDIGHQPYRTIWEHLSTIDRYTRTHAASMHQRGVHSRRWDPPLHAALHFVDSMMLKTAWRDGLDGVAVSLLGTVHAGLKWHRLRQLGERGP